jgi:SAM-dependent methyltransferase
MTDTKSHGLPAGDEADRDAAVRRRQRVRWDRIAEGMPDFFTAPSTQYYRRSEIALIDKHFGSIAGRRILKLDLWNEAINTRILHWMAARGARTFGLDVSNTVVTRAVSSLRENHFSPGLVQADVRRIPFADATFDFVYTMGTIEHIDEYETALSEIHRVLKEGGLAIVGVPHKWNIFLRPLLVSILEMFHKYPYSPEKSFSAGEMRRAVEKTGFLARRRTGILAIPGIVRMADLFCYRRNIPLYRLTPLALWPFECLERKWAWMGCLGYLLVLVVEKKRSNR